MDINRLIEIAGLRLCLLSSLVKLLIDHGQAADGWSLSGVFCEIHVASVDTGPYSGQSSTDTYSLIGFWDG